MKKGFISWNMFYEDVTRNKKTSDMSEQKTRNLFEEYRSVTEGRLKSYIEQKYPECISLDNDKAIIVRRDFLDDADKAIDLKDYFQYKEGIDFSAEDIAKLILNRAGIPPIETMTLESLEKKIRGLFNSRKYEKSIYVKRSKKKGGRTIACVDWDTVQELERNEEIRALIRKQINKAERNNKDSDSVAWKRYERETSYFQFLDELQAEQVEHVEQADNSYSSDEKIFFMIQALYSLFFTNCDFGSFYDERKEYNMIQALYSLFFTDYNFDLLYHEKGEYELLEASVDFGKRFQELEEVFNAPHFDWKYYRLKDIEDSFLDGLAEKIAAANLNRTKGKEG